MKPTIYVTFAQTVYAAPADPGMVLNIPGAVTEA